MTRTGQLDEERKEAVVVYLFPGTFLPGTTFAALLPATAAWVNTLEHQQAGVRQKG